MHKLLDKWIHKKNILTNIDETRAAPPSSHSLSPSHSLSQTQTLSQQPPSQTQTQTQTQTQPQTQTQITTTIPYIQSSQNITMGSYESPQMTHVSPIPSPVSQDNRFLFGNMQFRNENLVKLYRGKYLHKLVESPVNIPVVRKYNKVIVFDLDETIGSFLEFTILYYGLERLLGEAPRNRQVLFNALLDLYPEFLRYGIMHIFGVLHKKKRTNECYKIYIYTNNKYSPDFPQQLQNYIDYKLGTTGFIDKIICAFKIGDRIIEPLRTTHEKTHGDFIQCTMLPKNTEICFIDNTFYSQMKHHKIFYIQPKNYHHNLEWKHIVDVFIQSTFYNMHFDKYTKSHMRDYLYGAKTSRSVIVENAGDHQQECIAVYKKMLYYIKEFFLLTTRHAKTKKIKCHLGKYTRKHKKK